MPFSFPVARRTFSIARSYEARQSPSSNRSTTTTIIPSQSQKKQTRSYPIRKQFIFESYLDLLTNNQLCLLFRHQHLSSREWNSIRGKIKQIPAHTTTTTQPSPPPPQLQVLRTKMLLPVLKTLLKTSRISRLTYDSLVYAKQATPQPNNNSNKKLTNLSGSLVALSQAHFDPAQLKQVLQIICPQHSLSNKTHQQDQLPLPHKIHFLVGFIDSSICANHHDLNRFSSLNSLQTSHSQLITLINQSSHNLLATLNHARASQLLHTLKGFQQTLHDQQSASPPPLP